MQIKRPEIFNTVGKVSNLKLWKQIVIFIGLFLVLACIGAIPAMFATVVEIIVNKISIDNMEAINQIAESRLYIYASLFGTALSSVLLLLYTYFVEKRSLHSFGLQRKNLFRDYGIGIIIGFAMFSLVICINLLTGAMTIEKAINSISLMNVIYIFLFFIAFLFQGAYEELLIRGYFMVNIGSKHKTITAIIISSLAFAIMHGANSGITLLALINLTLAAVFFTLYMICFENIWGVCAIHSIWNFTQGNFYGVRVSGIVIPDKIFATTNIPGKELINGGAFGAEGGIATTIVFMVSILLLIIYMKKKGKIFKEV